MWFQRSLWRGKWLQLKERGFLGGFGLDALWVMRFSLNITRSKSSYWTSEHSEHFRNLFADKTGVCFPKRAWGACASMLPVQHRLQSAWLWGTEPDQWILFIKYNPFACSLLYVRVAHVERDVSKISRIFWTFNKKLVWIKGSLAARADEAAGEAGVELISILLSGSYLKERQRENSCCFC